jgi:hypothetical protein
MAVEKDRIAQPPLQLTITNGKSGCQWLHLWLIIILVWALAHACIS